MVSSKNWSIYDHPHLPIKKDYWNLLSEIKNCSMTDFWILETRVVHIHYLLELLYIRILSKLDWSILDSIDEEKKDALEWMYWYLCGNKFFKIDIFFLLHFHISTIFLINFQIKSLASMNISIPIFFEGANKTNLSCQAYRMVSVSYLRFSSEIIVTT